MLQNFLPLISKFASVVDTIPGVYQPHEDLESDINSLSLRVVVFSALSLLVLTIIAAFIKDRIPRLKLPVFILMALIMVASTFTLIGSTVYLNVKSESGGPIHWHTDFEIWACDNELELRDPTGFLSNKIGTSVLHEHNDKRIHLEGVAVDKEADASLGKFFHVIGGAVTENAMVVPLNDEVNFTYEDEIDGDGPATTNPTFVEPYIMQDNGNGRVAFFQDGQTCGTEMADVQVFVYQYDESTDTYTQTKLENPKEYTIYEDSNVPPGDCIIFEFDVTKDKTDKLCEQYGVRDIDRCDEFGVTDEQRAICSIEQLDYDSSTDYRRVETSAQQEAESQSAGQDSNGAAGTSPEGSEAPNDTPGTDEPILFDGSAEAEN